MVTGQTGLFALGDAAHGFFEFALRDGADRAAFVKAVADLRPPRTTVGGVNVSRTNVVERGDELEIFRRDVPCGTVSEHGTLFIGFSSDQRCVHKMVEQMARADGGPRDALTRYSTPLTGAYYFVLSVQALHAFTTPGKD